MNEIMKMLPKVFSINLASENIQNASELHSKQLRFWMQNCENVPRTFFENLVSGELPKFV